MLKKIFVISIFVAISTSLFAIKGSYTVSSPDDKIKVEMLLIDGKLAYRIKNNSEVVVEMSKLGLVLDKIDLSKKLEFRKITKQKLVCDTYDLLTGKRTHCIYRGNERTLTVANNENDAMEITFKVSDDGVAFRYRILNSKNSTQEYRILNELSSFKFDKNTTSWLHPRQKAGSGWCRTQPSYEENYQQQVLVGTKSSFNEGWTFPALFKTKNTWVLMSETDLQSNYCASHLSENVVAGEYSLAFADILETVTSKNALPHSTLDWITPWRVLIIGSEIKTIVESSLATDLAAPAKSQDYSFAKPGVASWSWAMLNDTATVYSTQKQFVDYAASMKWTYCLIDALWDTQIGYEKIKELADYAKLKGVGIWLWYNSAGNWNDTPQTPKDKLFDAKLRKLEFAKLQQMGIKGVKVDFFPGDGQSVVKYQQDILIDAAKYQLMVNFHGAAFSRGWTRTYPNLMTTEAVKGFEYRTFKQENEDVVPTLCCMLPFTRNAIAPMDFTPLCFSEISNIKRITSNAFELALSIIFESGIQHFVETPVGMAAVPDYVSDFLQIVPTTWDETKYIDGFPGKYVVIARKKNNKWYVAGINACAEKLKVSLNLSFIGVNKLKIIQDGENNRSFILKNQSDLSKPIQIEMESNGGFILY